MACHRVQFWVTYSIKDNASSKTKIDKGMCNSTGSLAGNSKAREWIMTVVIRQEKQRREQNRTSG
jgi:hypothetical protein